MDISCNKCGTNIVHSKNCFPNNFEYKPKVAFNDLGEIMTKLYGLINLIKINNNKTQKDSNIQWL